MQEHEGQAESDSITETTTVKENDENDCYEINLRNLIKQFLLFIVNQII